MSIYRYASVPNLHRNLPIPRALMATGCEVPRAPKATRGSPRARTELRIRAEFPRAGDSLVVTCGGPLARSLKELQDIVHEPKARGFALKTTERSVDLGTAAGKCKSFLDMLPELKADLRRERGSSGSECVQRAQIALRCGRSRAIARRGRVRARGNRARLGRQAAVAANGGVDADQT